MLRTIKFALIITLGFLLGQANAQVRVSGKITDLATNKPVDEASIYVGNSTVGTKTGATGGYSLMLSPGNYELVVSRTGYKTKVQVISVGAQDLVADVSLEVRTIALKEVNISDDSWKHDLELFKAQFIGTTDPKDCELVNAKVLDLDFDHDRNRLTASNNDLLEIKNNYLGYKLRFLIKEFWADFNTGKCHYNGSVVFEEMQGSKSDEKRWAKNRQDAYKGSFTHFLTALSKKQLAKEKFVVYKMTRAPNPAFKQDSTRMANVRNGSTQLRPGVIRTVTFLREVPRNVETLTKKPLSEDEIMKPTEQSNLFKLQFPGLLYVIYKGKTVDADLDDLKRQPEAYYYQIAALSMKDANKTVLFTNDGQLLTHDSLFFEGAWDSRIIYMLPTDYVPIK